MKNTFFKIAMAQAAHLTGKPGRMLQLVAQLTHHLYQADRIKLSGELHESLRTMGRLIASYAFGRYRVVPTKTAFTILAALIYFLNPFDLVPDAILGIGLADDLAVLTWVYQSSQQELNKFIKWEISQRPFPVAAQ